MEWFVWSFRWIVIYIFIYSHCRELMKPMGSHGNYSWLFLMEMKVFTRVSDTHVRLWPLMSGSMDFRIWTCIVGGYGLEPCTEFVWFSIFDIVPNWWRALLSLGNQCLKMCCGWGGDWSTIKFSQIWLFKKYERQILKRAYTFFCYLLEPFVEMWCLKIFLIQFFKLFFSQKIIEFATISSWIFATLWNITPKWPFSFWATS